MTIEWIKETKKPKEPNKYFHRRNEILVLLNEGKNQNKIAKQIGISRQAVNIVIKGMKKRGEL